MFHCIKKVIPEVNYVLIIQFVDGEEKQYDVKPLFKEIKDFLPLMYVKGLFEQVKVDAGGYGISWNDNIDLSCNELYENGSTLVVPDNMHII